MNTTVENITSDDEEYQCVELKEDSLTFDDVDSQNLELEKGDHDFFSKEELIYTTLDEDQCENVIGEELLLNEEQIYNCNDCNVTFTSVEDHIQQYHQNQDILIAVSMNNIFLHI